MRCSARPHSRRTIPPTDTVRLDPTLGWRAAPGSRHVGADWTVDADGTRLDPTRPPAQATDARVVVVGDSYTFGVDVADPHTWPARLAAHMDDVDVRNVAAPGWGHDQIVLRAEQAIAEGEADLLVVGWTPVDLPRNGWRTTFGPKPWTEVQAGRAVIHPVESSWAEAVHARQATPRLVLLANALWERIVPPHAPEVQRGAALLDRLLEAAEGAGIPLQVVQLELHDPVLSPRCGRALDCVDGASPRHALGLPRPRPHAHFTAEENDAVAQAVAVAVADHLTALDDPRPTRADRTGRFKED